MSVVNRLPSRTRKDHWHTCPCVETRPSDAVELLSERRLDHAGTSSNRLKKIKECSPSFSYSVRIMT